MQLKLLNFFNNQFFNTKFLIKKIFNKNISFISLYISVNFENFVQ